MATACIGLALVGCTAADGTPMVFDGTLIGSANELANPGSTVKAREAADKARQAADDKKCRDLGFKLGTEPYGNCRLQAEQIRATNNAANAAQDAADAAWAKRRQ